MILIPKYRDVVLPLRSTNRFSGRYRFDARMADGRIRPLTDWIPNLITNGGADMLGNGTSPLTYCAVGSGNATPVVTNTTLQSLIASTSSTQSSNTSAQSSPPYYGSRTIVYSFGTGVAAGNLSEVGVGSAPTSLFSRALILDGGGSPTTITVLGSESLYVTYQLNQYVPTADVTGSVVIAGVTYAYTLRAADANTTNWAYFNGDPGGIRFVQVYNGAIGVITSSPSGTSNASFGVVNTAYSNGSHTRSGDCTFDITQGNVSGGVTAAWVSMGQFASRGNYQVGFGAAIPKDSSHVLTLSFSHSWVVNSP